MLFTCARDVGSRLASRKFRVRWFLSIGARGACAVYILRATCYGWIYEVFLGRGSSRDGRRMARYVVCVYIFVSLSFV